MKSVVITGSARGLGFEMAKCFRKRSFNVVISDLYQKDLDKAKEELLEIKSIGLIECVLCDVTSINDINNLIKIAKDKCGKIDFFINNAGINQADKMIWELSYEEISKMIDVDLRGTMLASKTIMEEMKKQNSGSIYNVEGLGSNNVIIPGLSVYGTTKRAVTYFTTALAKEAESAEIDVIVGRLSPGIMITDFIVNSNRDKKIELSDKTKKNI